jgi:small conductance mechanosensitive channel
MLRLVVKTTPSQQWRVSRELRERIKVAFDEEGIEIPFPQQTVWHKPAAVS